MGRIQDFWKGGHMFKGVGIRFADFISLFRNITWKWNNLVSLRPNYFIFIGYLKRWGDGCGEGVCQCKILSVEAVRMSKKKSSEISGLFDFDITLLLMIILI